MNVKVPRTVYCTRIFCHMETNKKPLVNYGGIMKGIVGLISHLIHLHSTHICLKPPFLTKVVGVSDYEVEQS